MGTLKPQYGDWYAGRWWWAVTFGTATRGLQRRAGSRLVPSSMYQM